MATVDDIINIMQLLAPEQKVYAKEYDNVGLLVGDRLCHVKKVMCCLDVTNDVLDEAVDSGVQMLVCHHPLIYGSISSVTADTVLGAKILRLARHGIAVYAAHTNLDFCAKGINEFAAEAIGLTDLKPLEPYINEAEGFGRIGRLKTKMTAFALMKHIKNVFGDPLASLVGEDRTVENVAVINGGAGGDTAYVDMARQAGADCLITGDIKHHVAVYAADIGFAMIEAQHFATEYYYIKRLVELLKATAKTQKIDIEIMQSNREKSPKRQEIL